MLLLKLMVVRLTLLNSNLFIWATFSEFLREDDIYPVYDTHSGEGRFLDDASKYSFEKRQRKKTTTDPTTPTYSEYETEEVFSYNTKERKMVLESRNLTDHLLNDRLQPSSETEFVGSWDKYPLFATPRPTQTLRQRLRYLDIRLSKILGNPQRYPWYTVNIGYLDLFRWRLREVYIKLSAMDKTVWALASHLSRASGPFFLTLSLNNDTFRKLGWDEDSIYEFYEVYDDILKIFRAIRKEYRAQRIDVESHGDFTSSQRKVAFIQSTSKEEKDEYK